MATTQGICADCKDIQFFTLNDANLQERNRSSMDGQLNHISTQLSAPQNAPRLKSVDKHLCLRAFAISVVKVNPSNRFRCWQPNFRGLFQRQLWEMHLAEGVSDSLLSLATYHCILCSGVRKLSTYKWQVSIYTSTRIHFMSIYRWPRGILKNKCWGFEWNTLAVPFFHVL